MISKYKPASKPTPYKYLAEYIAAAKEKGEKLEDFWIVNADAGKTLDDLDMAIDEIEATQALNVRAKGNKHYHLMISFPAGEKPSSEALRDIDHEMAKALGFEEHPRVVGTHSNTENFHMHIGYSRIHPKTLNIHYPKQDFMARDKVCRSMEQKYGLKVDLGREDKVEQNRKPEGARDMEANSWEQSFHSYVQEHKEPLMKGIDEAKTWNDVHEKFAEYDLKLRKRGNGLVITNGKGTQHIKASSIDRSLSKPALEKRLGLFEAQKRDKAPINPKKTYKRRPITKMRGQGRLWKRYLGVRRGKESLTGKAIKTWRDFLMLGVTDDPLAMAIIYAQKKLIEAQSMKNLKLNPASGLKPRLTLKKPSVPPPKRTFLTVPFEDRARNKTETKKPKRNSPDLER